MTGKIGNDSFIKIVSKIILTGFVVGILISFYNKVILSRGFPFSTFLFNPVIRFSDFFETLEIIKGNWHGQILGNYFPFTNIILYPLLYFDTRYRLFFLISLFVLFFLISSFIFLNSFFKKKNSALLLSFSLLFSYPFLFLLDRVNIEFVLYIFLFLFFYFFKNKKYCFASLFLSFAIALKGYPLVLLFLYLRDKNFKWFFRTLFFSIFLTLLSLLILNNSLFDFFGSFFSYNNALIGGWYVAFGNSLYGASRVFLDLFNVSEYVKNISFNFLEYFNLSFLFLVSVSVIFCKLNNWKSSFLLLASTCLFMKASPDYRLILLFFPLFLFLMSREKDKNGFFYALMFSLIFIPINWAFINVNLPYKPIHLSVILRPIIIFVMMLMIIIEGRPKNITLFLNSVKSFFTSLFLFFKKEKKFLILSFFGLLLILAPLIGIRKGTKYDVSLNEVNHKVRWSEENIKKIGIKILEGEIVREKFVPKSNNLGTIVVQFMNFNKINEGFVKFRLLNEVDELIYENIYKVDQFNPDFPFTFGFPLIENSKGKTYFFEIISIDGDENNSVALSNKNFILRYNFPFSKIKENPMLLLELICGKFYENEW